MNKWKQIREQINKANDIVILAHTNMDGDALGSASALCRALRYLGKQAVILLEDEIPGYLRFMVGDEEASYYVNEFNHQAELAISVDCADEGRFEKRRDVFKAAKTKICIDHHVHREEYADYFVVDPNASATAVLVFGLIEALGVPFDKKMANEIYLAILTDTGGFRFSNTNADAHLVTAKLYEYNSDFSDLGTKVYDSLSKEQLKLESDVVQNMEVFAEGKAVISSYTKEQFAASGASYDMAGGAIDVLRQLGSAEVCAFLKQHEDGSFKLSLRSKSEANVNTVAGTFGGGGHVKAAGATLNIPLEKALSEVKAAIEKELVRIGSI